MKVLQLCQKPPQPAIDGGCIAMSAITNGLLENGINVKIFTASTEKHPFLPDLISEDFKSKTQIESVFLDTRVNVVDAVKALVTSDSYNVSRFFSTEFEKRLEEILTESDYDIVQIESLFMTPYLNSIKKFSNAKIVLRSHNLEYLVWKRLAESSSNLAKKLYLGHLAKRLKQYEENIITKVDGVATISYEDAARYAELKCKIPIITIPFGIDLENYPISQVNPKDKLKLFHIGAMNWEPNKEAVHWLIDEIWPLVKSENVELHLAGLQMPPEMMSLQNGNLFIHGEVKDAVKFMNERDVVVAPLLSGSGMRIKIIEAMALGKAVITTNVGAEGIDCHPGEDILIANSKEEFAETITNLSKHPLEVQRIGKNSRKLVEEHYTNKKIITNLIKFYEELLS